MRVTWREACFSHFAISGVGVAGPSLAMRSEGTLVKWDAQRGFGFIAPKPGGEDLFVHISAFSAGEAEPVEGEVLTFEIVVDSDARKRKRAFRVQRPGQVAPQTASAPLHDHAHASRRRRAGHGTSKLVQIIVVIALIAAVGWFAMDRGLHQRFIGGAVPTARQPEPVPAVSDAQSIHDFRCDGRKYCSQMTSCAEAKFFLKNCPDPRMDGDHDGVPCEEQWCTSPLAS